MRQEFLAIILALQIFSPAKAAELVMLEQPGCAWCARFNSEIAPIWPRTDEGKKAPLRRVDITKAWPDELSGISRERFTPTFIVVENGAEIGRVRGYPGDEFFWFLIGEILVKMK